MVNVMYLVCKALLRQLRTGLDKVFSKGYLDVSPKGILMFILQKKKEAIESGKRQTENTLKEGNDILEEANRLADEINSVIDVSI